MSGGPSTSFRREGVEAVAVCLLWSFYNPVHERRIGEIVREEFPEAYLSLSVDVAPQIREYDRVSTTALNAYVGPRLTRYLQQTEAFLRDLGYTGEIRYIQSNGGIAAGERDSDAGRARAQLRAGGRARRRSLFRAASSARTTSSRSTWAGPASTPA